MFLNYFSKIVEIHSNHIAITWGTSNSKDSVPEFSLTYGELDIFSNQMATYLKQTTAKDLNQITVAICCNRTHPYWIICLLAVWKLRGVVLLVDKDLSKDEMYYRINNAGASIIITDISTLTADQFSQQLIFLTPKILELIKGQHNITYPINTNLEELAYIAYTSGTTGQSKAIAIKHSGIMPITLAHQVTLDIYEKDQVLQFSSFNFDACWMEFFMLSLGVRLVLPSTTENFLQILPDFVQSNLITIAIFVPSILEKLLPDKMPSLRAIISTGEAGSEQLFKKWQDRGSLPRRQIFNGYGPSEVTIGITIREYTDGVITLGKPIRESKIYLLNEDRKVTTEKGVIAIAGPGLAKCYLQNGKIWEEKTNTSFFEIEDPDQNGKKVKVYETGDLAHYDEQNQLIFDGRIDRQFKIYGMRLEASSIEEMISKILLEEVKQIYKVHVLPYYILVDDRKIIHHLTALIQTNSKEVNINNINAKDLRKKLLEAGLYKAAIPTTFYIITDDVIMNEGLLTNVKKTINHPLLQEKIKDPTFLNKIQVIPEVNQNTREYILTAVEEDILSMWRQILYLPEDTKIDPLEDDFLDIGGNSLYKIELIQKLEHKYEINLKSFPALPEKMTLQNLAFDVVRRVVYQKAWKLIYAVNDKKSKLFLVHPVSGATSEFRHLKLNTTLYALEAPLKSQDYIYSEISAYKEKYFCTDIPSIAAYAFYGMKQIQPSGPYCIGGYSFGGIVAVEMARQLIKQNEELAYVALLDPPVPDFLQRTLKEGNEGINEIGNVILKICQSLNINLDFNGILIKKDLSPRDKIKKLFKHVNGTLKILENYEQEKLKIDTLKKAFQIFQVVENNLLAFETYTLKEPIPYQEAFHLSVSKDYADNANINKLGSWYSFFSPSLKNVTYFSQTEHLQLLKNDELAHEINKRMAKLTMPVEEIYLPKLWKVPCIIRSYVDRNELTSKLHKQLTEPTNSLVCITACYGLGGVGKTQLAINYVHSHRREYQNIFWFLAESEDHLLREYRALAERLSLPIENKSLNEIAERLKEWFEENNNWLLIYDNAPDDDLIKKYRPRFGGKILITSRKNSWDRQQSIDVDVFTTEEAHQYIVSLTGFAFDENKAAIEKLARTMGNLPLALAQACAYISTNTISINDYLADCERNIYEYLEDETMPAEARHAPVAITLKITFKAIEMQRKTAYQLLKYCAFLCADNIHDFFLWCVFDTSSLKIEELLSKKKPKAFIDALGCLQQYSILKKSNSSQEATFNIHRLVQEIVFAQCKNDATEILLHLIKVLNKLLDIDYRTLENWQSRDIHGNRVNLIISHVENVLAHAKSITCHENDWNLQLAKLLWLCAEFYSKKSQTDIAELKLLEARSIIEKLNLESPENKIIYADILLGLGRFFLWKKDGYALSLEASQKAYDLMCKLYGENAPNTTMRAYGHLGVVYRCHGYIEQAIPIFEDLLKRPHLPRNDWQEAGYNFNLALIYMSKGRADEAMGLFEKSRQIYEKHQHPQLYVFLNDLGWTYYRKLEDLSNAEKCFQRIVDDHQSDATYSRVRPIILAEAYYGLAVLNQKTDINKAKNIVTEIKILAEKCQVNVYSHLKFKGFEELENSIYSVNESKLTTSQSLINSIKPS